VKIPIVSCPICFFECELENQLIKHVVRFHKHDSAFRIKCNHYGCGATFRKWKSFKQHIRRNHQDNLQNVDRNVDSPENVIYFIIMCKMKVKVQVSSSLKN